MKRRADTVLRRLCYPRSTVPFTHYPLAILLLPVTLYPLVSASRFSVIISSGSSSRFTRSLTAGGAASRLVVSGKERRDKEATEVIKIEG